MSILARVCHSPTGYGLKQTFGTSAGTQHFESVSQADVILVIGANPTDAHPVFAARMKKRLRAGASLIVVDPRRIDLVRSPHVEAAHHPALTPGTNVAMMNAFAHVVVTEGLWTKRSFGRVAIFRRLKIGFSLPVRQRTRPSHHNASRRGCRQSAAARSMRGRTEQRFTMVLASQNIPKGPAW